MPQRLRFACALAALAALSWACNGTRPHDQDDGVYTLTADTVIRDDCGRLSSSTDLFSVELTVAGDVVQLRKGPYGMLLMGGFLSKEERFRADGSAGNVFDTLRGAECFLDEVAVHLDADTTSPTTFDGTVTFYYQAQTDACTCRVWATYHAQKE